MKERLKAVAGWIPDAIPDALMAGGAAAVSYGVSLVHQPAGVVVGGLFLLAAGWLLARGSK